MSIVIGNQTDRVSRFLLSHTLWEYFKDSLSRSFIEQTHSSKGSSMSCSLKRRDVSPKPEWVNCPDRAWHRHSALLTCIHDMQREK